MTMENNVLIVDTMAQCDSIEVSTEEVGYYIMVRGLSLSPCQHLSSVSRVPWYDTENAKP